MSYQIDSLAATDSSMSGPNVDAIVQSMVRPQPAFVLDPVAVAAEITRLLNRNRELATQARTLKDEIHDASRRVLPRSYGDSRSLTLMQAIEERIANEAADKRKATDLHQTELAARDRTAKVVIDALSGKKDETAQQAAVRVSRELLIATQQLEAAQPLAHLLEWTSTTFTVSQLVHELTNSLDTSGTLIEKLTAIRERELAVETAERLQQETTGHE